MFVKIRDISGPESKRDPIPVLRNLLQAGPIVESKIPLFGKLKFATTYSAVDQVLRDRHRFVLQAKNAGVGPRGDIIAWMPRPIRVLANNMLQKDEPDHRRLRSLAEIAFRRHNVTAMRSGIEATCDEIIDQIGHAPSFDLLEMYARVLPLTVICDLLGLPKEDQPQLSKWIGGLTNASLPWGLFTSIPGILKVNRYLRDRFRQERTNPGSGLICELVAAEENGQQLNEEELLAMTFILFLAGHETTTHLITLSLLTLLTRPELKQQWIAEPEVRPNAVDELLRFLSPVQMTKPRYAAEDTEIDGVPIRRGQRVLGFLSSANMDPNEFAAPEEIDFTRTPNRHKGFGGGIHYCLGAQLARLETELAITRILERLPNLRIRVPESELRWTARPGIRSLKELPVSL